jgi:hypothetical protein
MVGWMNAVPASAKLQALLSGIAWLSVGSCGRLIAYF